MKTKPDLGIKNPYALDQTSSSTPRSTCSSSRTRTIGEYWSDYTKEVQALRDRRLRARHHLAGHRQPGPGGDEGAGRGDPAEGGRHRLVGHLDGRGQGQAPELRVQVDGLDHLARRSTPQVAEWFGEAPAQTQGLRRRPRTRRFCDDLPRRRRGVLRPASGTGPRRPRSASTAAATSRARTTRRGRRPGPRSRADRRPTRRRRRPATPGTRRRCGPPASCTATRGCGWPRCWPRRCPGWSSPTSARSRCCSSPRSGRPTRFTGDVVQHARRWTTSGPSSTEPVYRTDRAAHASAWPRR